MSDVAHALDLTGCAHACRREPISALVRLCYRHAMRRAGSGNVCTLRDTEGKGVDDQALTAPNLWRTFLVALPVAALPMSVGAAVIIALAATHPWSAGATWLAGLLIYALAAGTACLLVLRRLFPQET
jgi:hypothetical protein